MDKVEQLMANRKWVKHCLRTNCAAPEDIQLTGKVKTAKIYSNLLYKREKEPELYDAIEHIAPRMVGRGHADYSEQGPGSQETQGREQGAFMVLVVGRLHVRWRSEL